MIAISSGAEKASTINELFKATRKCANNVRWKDGVLYHEMHSLTRSKKIRDELLSGTYKIRPYTEVRITHPKPRIAEASSFRDRVWQRSMCDNGVYDQLTRSNIYDNGSCQVGKGTEHAIRRTVALLQKYYRKYGTNIGYVKHLDVRKYFPSTPHDVALNTIRSSVSDESFLPHLEAIVNSYKDKRSNEEEALDCVGERGIGLGSPISQLIELAIPTRIDHAIKERFNLAYVRVMDDFLLFGFDKENVENAAMYIKTEMSNIGFTIKDKTNGDGKLEHGFHFVQFKFTLSYSGEVVVKPSKRKICNERRKLKRMASLYWNGGISIDDIERHYQSFISSIFFVDSYNQICKMDKLYTELFRRKPNYQCIKRRSIYAKYHQNPNAAAP